MTLKHLSIANIEGKLMNNHTQGAEPQASALKVAPNATARSRPVFNAMLEAMDLENIGPLCKLVEKGIILMVS